MYIHPFICGVATTIVLEFLVIVIGAVYFGTKSNKGEDNDRASKEA